MFFMVFLCCSVFVRYIHVVACSLVHSFSLLDLLYDYHNLFLYSTDDGHLGCSNYNITIM